MYQGKRYKRSHRRSSKSTALLVSLLLLLGVTVGGTIAFLMDSDGPLNNIFNPSKVKVEVKETTDGNIKSNVCIENTGDTEAWVRAAVVVTWQDDDGNVYGQAPVAGTDYTAWTPGDGWMEGADDFYYYTTPVAADGTTEALIGSISQSGNSPAEGFYLTVEIVASGIQSKPVNVFDEEWGSSGLKVEINNSDAWILSKEVQR